MDAGNRPNLSSTTSAGNRPHGDLPPPLSQNRCFQHGTKAPEMPQEEALGFSPPLPPTQRKCAPEEPFMAVLQPIGSADSRKRPKEVPHPLFSKIKKDLPLQRAST